MPQVEPINSNYVSVRRRGPCHSQTGKAEQLEQKRFSSRTSLSSVRMVCYLLFECTECIYELFVERFRNSTCSRFAKESINSSGILVPELFVPVQELSVLTYYAIVLRFKLEALSKYFV